MLDEPGSAANRPQIQFLDRRLVDRAQEGGSLYGQPYHDAELSVASQELPRSIQRVDDPQPARGFSRNGRTFLAEDRIGRSLPLQKRKDRVVRRVIRPGDRSTGLLGAYLDFRVTVEGDRGCPASQGRLRGREKVSTELVGHVHACLAQHSVQHPGLVSELRFPVISNGGAQTRVHARNQITTRACADCAI